MEKYIPIIERLKREEKDILIFTHENPDGDGIGSMIALYLFLKKIGKNVVMAMKDDVPYVYNFLPKVDEIKKLPINHKFSVAILVDASSRKRAGTQIQSHELIRIDHHIGGEFESIYDYVDDYSPSTTAVVTEILRNWDESLIDKEIATCLYTGLITDTGSFKYNNTTSKTFEIAKFLTEKGADPFYISKMVFERNKVNVLMLLQKTLSTLELYNDGKIAVLTVFRDFLNQTNTLEEDTEGFVNFARSIESVKVAIIMIQKEDLKTWRVSLRGKGDVDVQEIAKYFGGGGHKDAAGCRIMGEYEKVKESLVDKVSQKLENLQLINV
ncbi:bifunctional oligoribonuclease/PAP phosphatase NrnA [Sulfurihydrogenibium sp.]|uniref:DHH family phosphoesterase n=1 Tax=Sulfurihydrogenibium sp. TaxID=2053621 RepID=UPI002638C63B|nr:bifunctional oligoribonuclease/PAP phosphatase NrnA [Sulfurihydrogenibium sp.]